MIDGFFATVNPNYAIISAGTNEKWNFPDEQVVNALKTVNANMKIYITKKDGTILLKSDGNNILEPEFINKNFDGNK